MSSPRSFLVAAFAVVLCACHAEAVRVDPRPAVRVEPSTFRPLRPEHCLMRLMSARIVGVDAACTGRVASDGTSEIVVVEDVTDGAREYSVQVLLFVRGRLVNVNQPGFIFDFDERTGMILFNQDGGGAWVGTLGDVELDGSRGVVSTHDYDCSLPTFVPGTSSFVCVSDAGQLWRVRTDAPDAAPEVVGAIEPEDGYEVLSSTMFDTMDVVPRYRVVPWVDSTRRTVSFEVALESMDRETIVTRREVVSYAAWGP